jgi:hypothetical protein
MVTELLDVTFEADIASNRRCFSAERPDLRQGFVGVGAVRYDNVCAFGREARRKCATDTGCRARYDGRLALVPGRHEHVLQRL